MKENDGIWVFLSHSNKDFEKVRVVRNLLEEQSYKPIMFFLKALNDDDEIDSLIKREIDARQLFILCDSDNARKSKWVNEEVKYILNKGVVWEKINIDDNFDNIRKQLCRFKSRNRIYINSTIDDSYVVNKIVRYFQSKDYDVIAEKDYHFNQAGVSSGYLINIFSYNILKKSNTPRFVMNHNSFLSVDYLRNDTAVLNVYINPKSELLPRYYQDPGVERYEKIAEDKNKIVDIDFSDVELDDLPSRLFNFLYKIDRANNNVYSYAKSYVKEASEIEIIRKILDIEIPSIDSTVLVQYGFSFDNHNEFDTSSNNIIRSSAMFELGCNLFVGAACERSFDNAIELFYDASNLGMKNAQKILYELGCSLISMKLVKRIESEAFHSQYGFTEYLLGQCIELGKSTMNDENLYRLYTYSAQKGCWFGREQIADNYSPIVSTTNTLDAITLNRICETHWWEFTLCEYPSKIDWHKLYTMLTQNRDYRRVK